MGRFRVTVEGNPGDGGTNGARRATTVVKSGRRVPATRPSDTAKRFKVRLRAAVLAAIHEQPEEAATMRSARTLGVSAAAYWPRAHRKDPTKAGLAQGDVDACIKLTLDGLQDMVEKKTGRLKERRLIDDDTRFVEATLAKHYDKDRPRIEVEVWVIS